MATEYTHPNVVVVALREIQAAEDEEARNPPPPRGVTLRADGSSNLPASTAIYASIRTAELATIRNPDAVGSFILNPQVFNPDGSLVTGRLPIVDEDSPQLLVDPLMVPLRRDTGQSTNLADFANQAIERLINLTGSSTTQETLQEPVATAGSNKSRVFMKWTPRKGEASNQTAVVWSLEMKLDTAFGTVAFDEFAKHAKKPNSSFAWSLQRGNRKTNGMKMVARDDTIGSLGLTAKDTPILHGRLVHDGDKASIPGDSSASKVTARTDKDNTANDDDDDGNEEDGKDKNKANDDDDEEDDVEETEEQEPPTFSVKMKWTPKAGESAIAIPKQGFFDAVCRMDVGANRKFNTLLWRFERDVAFKPNSVFVWEHNGKAIDRFQTVDSLGVDPSVEIKLVATLFEGEVKSGKPKEPATKATRLKTSSAKAIQAKESSTKATAKATRPKKATAKAPRKTLFAGRRNPIRSGVVKNSGAPNSSSTRKKTQVRCGFMSCIVDPPAMEGLSL